MDYFIHQVSSFWYRLYYAWMTLFAVAVVGGSVASQNISGLKHYADMFGLTTTSSVLAGALLVYCLSLYWLIAKYTQSFAVFLGAMLLLLVVMNGMQQTGMTMDSIPYVIGWGTLAALSGVFGLPIALGSPFLTFLYVLVQDDFDITSVNEIGWVLIGINTLLAGLGYVFWRSKFVDANQQTVSKLSGQLKTNQQQSEILIQSIADGVIVINTEGKINLINPTAATLTGWTVSDAAGVDVHLVVKLSRENGSEMPPEENPFTKVLSEAKPLNQMAQITGKDSTKKTVSLVVSPVVSGNTLLGVVAVIRDISEEHAAEQQRAEFISTASHEMRTPVAAIEGYLALALNDKVSTIDSRARGYLDKAHASTQHLGKLFQDLLTSAKAEDGRLSSHPMVVEMGTFLEQLVEDLKFAAQKKGLLTEFVVGATDAAIDATGGEAAMKVVKPLYYVHADPERLREVVTNIFDNAIKYTDQGKVAVGLTGNMEVVQIYIRDTGPGIPATDIPHLFQKFYRVDSSATRVIGGTGLGLFICRKIIELYSGRVWVESELGKGSTFFINLPRLSTARAQQMQTAEASAPIQPLPPSNTTSK